VGLIARDGWGRIQAMGMAADLIAIGPFSSEVAPFLEYPSERYRHTREGTPVIRQLFGITHGSNASTAFAACLGISDPWDFNQHKIVSANVDLSGLRDFFATLQDGEEFLPELEVFVALRAHGFDFFFRPNG
jgi:hypothetical protein